MCSHIAAKADTCICVSVLAHSFWSISPFVSLLNNLKLKININPTHHLLSHLPLHLTFPFPFSIPSFRSVNTVVGHRNRQRHFPLLHLRTRILDLSTSNLKKMRRQQSSAKRITSERVTANKCSKSPTNNGGFDAYSYTNNCSLQEKILDSIKPLMHEAVAEELDLETLSFPSTIRIVDMGCSVGPNTFFAVQNIIEAVESKYPNSAKIPEIQVFFNDQALNDFNTLFASLPKKKNYYAAGVPGSFYGRVFPESSLHVVYSSCSAIPWLSQVVVPEQVLENKGTYISNASDEVLSAYSNQCAKDMEKFWEARAQEMVVGGLMFIVFPTRPSENVPHSEFYLNKVYDTLGSCLVDMAKKGVIDVEKLDSFNLPLYFASPEEVEESIMRNGYFDIERRECLPHQKPHDDRGIGSLWMAKIIRAIIETPVKEHFGIESFDEIFDMFRKKLEEGYVDIMSGEAIDLFIVLKRKSMN